MNKPQGIAIDNAGNLFVSDTLNHRVRKIDAGTGLITTVAGNGHPGHSGDGGKAAGAQLNFPLGLAVDSAGNLFITEFNGKKVIDMRQFRLITSQTGPGTKVNLKIIRDGKEKKVKVVLGKMG